MMNVFLNTLSPPAWMLFFPSQGRFSSLLSKPGVVATPPMFPFLLELPAVAKVTPSMEINERLYVSSPSAG